MAGLEQSASASLVPESSSGGLVWEGEGVRLEVDEFRLRTNDRVFHQPDAVEVEAESYEDEAWIDGNWQEHGRRMRLAFTLQAEDDHWWIDRITTFDGVWPEAGVLVFDDLGRETRTPIGDPFTGDLDLRASGSARGRLDETGRLRLRGVRLDAFLPGSRRAPVHEDCQLIEKGQGRDIVAQLPLDLIESGHMPLDRLVAVVEDLGVCFEFRFRHMSAEGWDAAHPGDVFETERWCTTPPSGTVTGVRLREDERFAPGRFYVEIAVSNLRPIEWPEVPETGQGCPTR